MSVFTDTANTNFEALDDDSIVLSPPDIDIDIPDLTMDEPSKIEITDLTTGVVGGTGVFDSLMTAINAQLKEQFNTGRITSNNYGQVYSDALVQAMSMGIQFLATKEQTYYNNLLIIEQIKQAKLQNVTVELNIERTKLEAQLIYLQSVKENANIAVTKAQLGLSELDYQIKDKQLDAMDKDIEVKDVQILNLEKDLLIKDEEIDIKQQQELNLAKDLETKDKQLEIYDEDIILKQKQQLQLDKDLLLKDVQIDTGNKDIDIKDKQLETLDKDLEVKDAQITNLEKDATIKDKQALLYEEQKNAFIIDPKLKVANLYSNAWITSKTSDEGLSPPDEFTNTEINEVLLAIRTAAGLV